MRLTPEEVTWALLVASPRPVQEAFSGKGRRAVSSEVSSKRERDDEGSKAVFWTIS